MLKNVRPYLHCKTCDRRHSDTTLISWIVKTDSQTEQSLQHWALSRVTTRAPRISHGRPAKCDVDRLYTASSRLFGERGSDATDASPSISVRETDHKYYCTNCALNLSSASLITMLKICLDKTRVERYPGPPNDCFADRLLNSPGIL